MRRDLIDLAATAVATAVAATVLLLTELTGATGTAITVLRALAGLPLILVLPGYALSTLLVPVGSGWPRRISPLLWRSMWTAGLSLAVAVLGGLLLNFTPTGLTRASWTISLTAVTLLAVAASVWRRRSAADPASRAADPASRTASSVRRARAPIRASMRATAGYALAALAITGTALGLAVASAGWQHSPAFAQLWLVPAQSASSSSSVGATSNSAATSEAATLGVRSGYPRTETFHLVLRRGTHAIGTWDFTLTAGQTWQRTIPAPAGQQLAAQLTAAGRSTAQTVDITPGSAS